MPATACTGHAAIEPHEVAALTDLLHTLLKHDLVDELRTWVDPVLLGTGKRLFGDGTRPAALTLVESVTMGKGGVYLRYQRAGKPTYGKMGLRRREPAGRVPPHMLAGRTDCSRLANKSLDPRMNCSGDNAKGI